MPESDVRALCWAWLRAGVVHNGQLVRPRRGVAQGDLLSPLWCNLYLDPFDDSAEGRSGQLVRYADDLLYLTRTPAGAEAAQAHVTRELERLRLRLNPDKTRLTSFEEGFEYLGLEFRGSLITDLTWRPAVRGRPLIVGGYDQPVVRRPGERPPRVGPPGSRWRYALDAEIARAARRGRPPSQMAQAIAEALAAAEEEAEAEANQRSARLL